MDFCGGQLKTFGYDFQYFLKICFLKGEFILKNILRNYTIYTL